MDFLLGNLFCVIVSGVLSLMAALFLLSYFYEKKRTNTLREKADELGLQFFAEGDPALTESLGKFQLFSRGRSRRVRNMIHGETAAVDMAIFDYQFTTGSGKNSTTWRQSVIVIQTNELSLPQFALRPESWFDRIGGMFGLQDIDFENHPDFSSKYVLQGENEEQIRQVFTSGVLSFFEVNPGLTVEGIGRQLIVFRPNKRVSAAEVHSLMEVGFKVYGVFKG